MTAPDDPTGTVLAALDAAQRRFASDLLARFSAAGGLPADTLARALAAGIAASPERYAALQAEHARAQWDAWRQHIAGDVTRVTFPDEPAPDRRFGASEWRALPWFAWLRASYRASARWLEQLVDLARLDARAARRLRFAARQFVDAMSPANFAAMNPQAIRLALASRGESLARGVSHLQADMALGRISMSDPQAFEVGRNVAVTPGSVVHRNELIELIQYRPAGAREKSRPLVIVPPCINKYYILDLQPENSFVRYAVAAGHTVFMVSWRNVTGQLGHLGWDDYLRRGVLTALEVARTIAGTRKVNALGFCVGGTLLASALAVARRERRDPVASLTLLATLLDFSDPGEIAVYLDETYVRAVEERFRAGGVLPGSQLAMTFASLRANELVWPFVENNYLCGRTPPAFDLLHWNGDSANLAGPMYAWYVRHLYLENGLREPDRLSMCNVPVDLGRITAPTFVLATEQDHIVPWMSAFASARLLGGPVTFVLGASGHIAGVVNPPAAGRRHYRTGPAPDASPDASPDAWLSASTRHAGSWWPAWLGWMDRHGGRTRPARQACGHARHPPLEDAPGQYVRARA